ncbi:hypothetical protein IQ07DRAFT_674741 [Pyrenochaeta sp. DS3sAY3a]|nr:hypothetical protein IQ07DRAFT_674741 [Pyrenochaeta sp. DS3sAY3a]
MANLHANLCSYHFEEALAANSADANDCFVLDLSKDDSGNAVRSREHILEVAACCLMDLPLDMTVFTKLYVIGKWVMAYEDDSLTLQEEYHRHHVEWSTVAEQMVELIETMPLLKEVTWISDLPFTAEFLDALPTTLTKLIVNLEQPVFPQEGNTLSTYGKTIEPSEMTSLLDMTQLEELRLFKIPEISFQPVVWGTVFRNKTAKGMKVLELEMARPAVVRPGDWCLAHDVVDLDVAAGVYMAQKYKGASGNGMLDWLLGFGQYLDVRCIRKARIVADLGEGGVLPLRCLKLDGIVVDHFPFVEELSTLELVVFSEGCVNAGLRRPSSSGSSNPIMMHWPKCAGAYQAHEGQ